MNEQQLFDAAYAGLAKQGFKRSVDSDGNCTYRSPDGLKCAIGHAIPDSLYSPTMDGGEKDAGETLEEILELIGYSDESCFAVELQSAHDCAVDPIDMQESLQNLAASFCLQINTGESPIAGTTGESQP